jgi:hypothetical protein
MPTNPYFRDFMNAHRPKFKATAEIFVKICISNLTLHPACAYKSKIERLFECPLNQHHGTLCEYLQIRIEKNICESHRPNVGVIWESPWCKLHGTSCKSQIES